VSTCGSETVGGRNVKRGATLVVGRGGGGGPGPAQGETRIKRGHKGMGLDDSVLASFNRGGPVRVEVETVGQPAERADG